MSSYRDDVRDWDARLKKSFPPIGEDPRIQKAIAASRTQLTPSQDYYTELAFRAVVGDRIPVLRQMLGLERWEPDAQLHWGPVGRRPTTTNLGWVGLAPAHLLAGTPRLRNQLRVYLQDNPTMHLDHRRDADRIAYLAMSFTINGFELRSTGPSFLARLTKDGALHLDPENGVHTVAAHVLAGTAMLQTQIRFEAHGHENDAAELDFLKSHQLTSGSAELPPTAIDLSDGLR